MRPAGLGKVHSRELADFISVCIGPREGRPRSRQLLKHPYFDSIRERASARAEALSATTSQVRRLAYVHLCQCCMRGTHRLFSCALNLPLYMLDRWLLPPQSRSRLQRQDLQDSFINAEPHLILSPTQVDMFSDYASVSSSSAGNVSRSSSYVGDAGDVGLVGALGGSGGADASHSDESSAAQPPAADGGGGGGPPGSPGGRPRSPGPGSPGAGSGASCPVSPAASGALSPLQRAASAAIDTLPGRVVAGNAGGRELTGSLQRCCFLVPLASV